jgi:Holliday junction resolvasome RuvABC endonuclease subunit
VVAVDPGTYNVGFAVFEATKLRASGVIEIPKKLEINERLAYLLDELTKIAGKADVLALELLRGQMAHAYLVWSAGVAVAAVRAPVLLEIPVVLWKAAVEDDYQKSDQNDAQMLGRSLIWFAKDLIYSV